MSYLVFEKQERPADRKTDRWDVQSRDHGSQLGTIAWYGPWRCYVFEPEWDTVWSVDCLRDVAAFIEARMAERR
jgi:hypothetical protein